ncbi:MAG: SDR family NAD(P)-dependent oxidoreductase [Actinomycetota bacterium]
MTERRTVLITGASSGFGAGFAKLFARDGFDLVLVARSGVVMEELAQELEERHRITATVLPKDLSRVDACRDIVDNLKQRAVRVDALVNNAGFAQYGPFVAADPRELVDMLRVNMVTLSELTRAFLPGMVDRGWGRILNLGSVGSFGPAPMTAAYAATKAYVLSLSLALQDELRGTGVTVTALCPGPTETGFQARAEMADSKLVAGRRLNSADAVVRAGYEAMRKGRPYLVTGATSRVFAFGSRFLPRMTTARIAGDAQRRIAG